MIDDLAHIYRYEPRGCGRSSATGPYDLQTTLADLEGLRSLLGYDRWLVGGHSWGSGVALAYALEYPGGVTGLIYLSGAGVQNDRGWHTAYEKGREQGLEQDIVFEYPSNMEVNRAGNASWRQYIQQPLLLRRIAELDVPLLAVCGSKDIRPAWPVRQLVELMPAARYEEIAGAGHNIWLTHAEELKALLRKFLTDFVLPSSKR
jgi:proline iminopeptidase